MFEEVHDKNFNKHVKDETMKGNEEYKEWFAQQKAEEREAKRLEKERIAAERAERREVFLPLHNFEPYEMAFIYNIFRLWLKNADPNWFDNSKWPEKLMKKLWNF